MTPSKLILSYGKSKVVVALTTDEQDYLFHNLDYTSNPAAYADIETAICRFQEGGLTSGKLQDECGNVYALFNFFSE